MLSINNDKTPKKSGSSYPQDSEELFLATLKRKKPMAYDPKKRIGVYNREVNGGCVIGTWLPKTVETDAIENLSALDIPDKFLPRAWREGKIPKELLEELQVIHDDKNNWENYKTGKINGYGLVWSKTGIQKLSELRKKFNLKINMKEEIMKSKKAKK